jgi:uncharacterized protein YbjT (DUF2867 family)
MRRPTVPSAILVTGATGTVGTQLLRSLRACGVDAAAMTSRPGVSIAGVHTTQGDFSQPDTLATAFAGFDTVFLLQPLTPEITAYGLNALAAARTAEVRRLVRLSGAGADSKSPFSIAWRW